MLIDSDVLVWLTRGHPGAAQRLNEIHPWRISVVTDMELAQGCRDKAELARLKKGLAAHAGHLAARRRLDRRARLIPRRALGRCLDRRHRHRA